MNRRPAVLLMTALLATALPSGSASASCVSSLPVSDKHIAVVSCPGVHPGMTLVVPSKKWGEQRCVAGFAFADNLGAKYLSFPGRCHLDYECIEDTAEGALPPPLDTIVPPLPTCLVSFDSDEEPHYKTGGPIVRDANGARIGRIAYAVNKDGVNFALMRLERNVRLDPGVPFYGGPVRAGTPQPAQQVYVLSPDDDLEGVNARAGVYNGTAHGGGVVTEGGMTTNSVGAPVMSTDGGAIGMLTGSITVLGFVTQTNGPGVDRASGRMRLRLNVLTAKMK